MAMLAEPKRRKKWSLNPRGKLWANDETKLGQKLLEKMGWSKGKGLGRQEQGDLEPVRLRYKNDAEGVGYKAKDDQWIAHRDEFNAILGELNGVDAPVEIPETIPVKSLEIRSKSSKARVHYHKFTRGKDLSRYSATDLACILGKRAATDTVEPEADPPSSIEVEEGENEEEKSDFEHSHGVTTIHKGNINDYFASKMAALKEKQQQRPSRDGELDGSVPRDSPDIGPNDMKRVRFNEELNVVKEFCSKKRITEGDTADIQADEANYELEEPPKKKKKKSKEAKDENGEAVILESIADEREKGKEGVDAEAAPEGASAIPLKTEKKKKKKKKKEKTKAEDIVREEESTIDTKMETEDQLGGGEEAETAQVKKSKKKKKKGSLQEGVQSAAEEEKVMEEVPIEGVDKRKSKKKRKREGAGEEQPTESRNDDVDHHQDPSSGSSERRQADEKNNAATPVQDSTATKYSLPTSAFLDGSLTRPDAIKKAEKNYMLADFDRFKGANLFRIAGYGHLM